jgi:hypothetical protein
MNSIFYITRRLCLAVLLFLLILQVPKLVEAQQPRSSIPASYSLLDVLTMSAWGKNPTEFTPLPISDLSAGWAEPWIPPPNGELRLQRGGWVNTDSGFFSREFDPTFSFNAGTSGSRNEYIGAATLFLPLNRRLQIGLTIPWVDSLQGTDSLPSATSFGDVIITPQLMLEEDETRSVSLLVAFRTPTGESSTGNDKTVVTPTIAFWQDLPDHWQLRGGIGTDVATHGGEGPDEVFDLNLAAGNTLTTHEAAPFGDLTPYLSANLDQDFGSRPTLTNVSLTPGIRSFLGWHTYFIAGVEVPVTNPKPFNPGLTLIISRFW